MRHLQHRLLPAEVKAGAVRCNECEDIAKATPKKLGRKVKKEKKLKPKPERKPATSATIRRNRKIIVDSDDEDDEAMSATQGAQGQTPV